MKEWRKSHASFLLRFESVSKHNLGMVGVGVVILNPNGKIEIEYIWGLDNYANKVAEAYKLLQGLHMAKGTNIKDLAVLRDS